jgi:hypothetical protein
MTSEILMWISIVISGLNATIGVMFVILGLISVIRSAKHPECLIALTVLIAGVVTIMSAVLNSNAYVFAFQAYPKLSREIDFADLIEKINYIRLIPSVLNLGSSFIFANYLFKKYGVRVRILSVAIPITVSVLTLITNYVVLNKLSMYDSTGQLIRSWPSLLSDAWSIVLICILLRNRNKETVFRHLYIFNILGIASSILDIFWAYITYDGPIPAALVFIIAFVLFAPLPVFRNVYIFNSVRRAKGYFDQPKTVGPETLPQKQ